MTMSGFLTRRWNKGNARLLHPLLESRPADCKADPSAAPKLLWCLVGRAGAKTADYLGFLGMARTCKSSPVSHIVGQLLCFMHKFR